MNARQALCNELHTALFRIFKAFRRWMWDFWPIQRGRDPLELASLLSALSLPQQLPTATLHLPGVDGNTSIVSLISTFPPWNTAPWSVFKGQIAPPPRPHSLTGHCEGDPC